MKKILYVSSFPTHPVRGGFQARIRVIVESLKRLGVDLYFLYVDEGKEADIEAMKHFYGEGHFYTVPASRKPISFFTRVVRGITRRINSLVGRDSSPYVKVCDIFPNGIQGFFNSVVDQVRPEVVTTNLVFLSGVFDWCDSSIYKVLDVHDKFADRHKVYAEHGRQSEWYSISHADEANAVSKADVLMAIQEKERNYFQEISGRPTFTIGHQVLLEDHVIEEDLSENPTILFFASKGGINAHSYEFLVNQVIPAVQQAIPNVQVLVPGNINLRVEAAEPIQLLGTVEDLKAIYRKAWVVVNPAAFGTGLKIKNIEALGYGKSLVTSGHGAIGLESGIDQAFQVAEGAKDFADKLINILSNKQNSVMWGKKALAFARQNNEIIQKTIPQVFQLS